MSSIGDIAHALPAVSLIRQRMPRIFVGWVVRQRCASLLEGNPDIDKLYIIPNRGLLPDIVKMGLQLRAEKFDTALEMQGLALSGLLAMLTGARRRIGMDRNREGNFLFLNDNSVPGKDVNRHAVDIQYGFAEALGISVKRGSVPVQQYLVEAEARFAQAVLADLPRPIIALNCGASTDLKRWPADRWAQVGRRLAGMGASLVLLGGTQDVDTVGALQARIGASNVVNLAGKTNLRELASVVARCDLMISGDTGPLHIAVDVGAKCLGLYGPTTPMATGPYGDGNVAIWKPGSCSPCQRHPTCDASGRCLDAITPDDVIEHVQQMVFDSFRMPPAAAAR